MRKLAIVLIVSLTLAGYLSAQNTKPNVVFFLIDDMGWKDLGCYGGNFIETPFADKLSAEGIRFTNAYASPVCSPTRACLISGQNAARHGIWEVIDVFDRPYAKMKSPPKASELQKHIKTYANVLTEEGYVCGLVGKWHAGRTPQAHGFANIDNNIYDPELQEYAKENEGHDVGQITANAIEFIRENKDKPFFINISHHVVHAPLLAREDLIKKYQKKLRQTGIEDVHPTYAAMAETADESLGMLLDELDALNLTKNTVVVLYSDNGGLLGDLYLNTTTPMATTMTPLRGQKGSLYEGGIRVPLIVKWPDKVKPGSVSGEMVNSYDLFSTFIEIGNGKIPTNQQTDGISLVPLIKGEKETLSREALYWHFPTSQWTRNPAGAIRKGKYKLIEHFEDGRLELFDLDDDIGETNNLINKKPVIAYQLLNDLKNWRELVGAQMPIPNPDYDPLREKELGYHKFLE
jgi:uncharacterized sulfatase